MNFKSILCLLALAVATPILNRCDPHDSSPPPPAGISKPSGDQIGTDALSDILKKRNILDEDLVDPQGLAGSLLYKTKRLDGSITWSYHSVLPTSEKTTYTTIKDIVVDAIYDKTMALKGSISYVVTLGGDMNTEDKATLLLQDVYIVQAPTIDSAIQAEINAWFKAHPDLRNNGSVFYVKAVRYSLLTSTIYSLSQKDANLSGPIIGADGKFYTTSNVTRNSPVISVDTDQPDAVTDQVKVPLLDLPRMLMKVQKIQ